ncbi:HotDog domain-containing protein, partial [Trichoderma evansii]
LPLVKYLHSLSSLTENNTDSEIRELRLHSNKNPSTLTRHFVAGSLFGENKLPTYPRLFVQRFPTPRIIAALYIGSHLCGHPGFVHGGLPFVLFDDIFALCAGIGFKSGVAMTANMNIDFRKPCLPDRVYIIRAEVVKQEGRKAEVEGSMRRFEPFAMEDMEKLDMAKDYYSLSTEELNATLVAETKALFIEPKFANSMPSLLKDH